MGKTWQAHRVNHPGSLSTDKLPHSTLQDMLADSGYCLLEPFSSKYKICSGKEVGEVSLYGNNDKSDRRKQQYMKRKKIKK
jgi:hypothetical protein